MREKSFKPLIITQAPNLPIIVAVGASVVSFVGFWNLIFGELAGLIAFGAWFTWAWMELFQGLNWVRRLMGGIVMVTVLVVAMIAMMPH